MSQGTRIVLVVLAIGLFLCCVAGLGLTLVGTRFVSRALITDPEGVAAVGEEIAGYDVPAGYAHMFAMKMAGIRMVAIGPQDSPHRYMVLTLMQFPAPVALGRADLERQLEETVRRQAGAGAVNMEVVGEAQVTVKGEPVVMTVREGPAEGGERIRQMTGLFQGKEGPTVLMVMGDVADWDQPVVDGFIASIR